MASNSDDAKASRTFREIENRIVWLAAFLVCKGKTSALTSSAAKVADEALDAYQERFAAIPPEGM